MDAVAGSVTGDALKLSPNEMGPDVRDVYVGDRAKGTSRFLGSVRLLDGETCDDLVKALDQ